MSSSSLNRATTVEHATLVFERELSQSTRDVFQAFADARLRVQWSVPSKKVVLIYDIADFREGGIDQFRCGPSDCPDMHGMTWYIEIVPDQRIVSSESIVAGGRRLCASLTTLELTPLPGGTRLKSTTHVASFAGTAVIDGHRAGLGASLDQLVRHLRSDRAA